MVITYYGLSCFKIQSGDTTLAFDPFSKECGLTPPRFQTDIALSSHTHENHGNLSALNQKGEKEIFMITGPGEYEYGGVRIKGITTYHDQKEGKAKGKNTVFFIELEDMRLVHMGDYNEKDLREEVHEFLDTPDVLFVPVGGGEHTIDAEVAAKIINRVNPRIVIPTHYKIPSLKYKIDAVEAFLKEMGSKTAPEDKFTVKKSGLPSAEESKVVVLKTVL